MVLALVAHRLGSARPLDGSRLRSWSYLRRAHLHLVHHMLHARSVRRDLECLVAGSVVGNFTGQGRFAILHSDVDFGRLHLWIGKHLGLDIGGESLIFLSAGAAGGQRRHTEHCQRHRRKLSDSHISSAEVSPYRGPEVSSPGSWVASSRGSLVCTS